ncbi:Nif3-like dinuclear metal center hexameric protein [Actinomyces vulturis]|uniref:Nif3-like dinuclear metal center hexameric protein n=1 Tax=Actinomyces vulturis TaxID=1857645 RepID=UPI00082B9E60|nr:Nif3-like dinuclear metal center hexameric protein [Actinomyces vulturis]
MSTVAPLEDNSEPQENQSFCHPTVGDIIEAMESFAPPQLAESWDSNGLICGERSATVRKIMLAVDPVNDVAGEAVEWGADMLLTHHPLFLRGTNSVSCDDPKGKVIHTLIRSGVALYNAHTNLDSAHHGVAQALADVVGLESDEPLEANDEYENLGIGRVGKLREPGTLREVGWRIAQVLPDSVPGLLISGDPDAEVRTMAVSGGAGDSLLGAARAKGVDAFLTADLRHHPAGEHAEGGKPFLICGTHWATEWVGLPPVADFLTTWAQDNGYSLTVRVSHLVTDPWTLRIPTGPLSEAVTYPYRDEERERERLHDTM